MEIIIRDFRNKQFFQVDDIYLNGYAKLCGVYTTCVYLSLCRHTDKEQTCFPSIKLIAQEFDINEKTVQRAIKKLEEFNIIKKERTRKKDGKWLNNLYILVDKKYWKKEANTHESPVDSQGTLSAEPKDSDDLANTHQSPTKYTHTKDTHIKDTHIAGKPANQINLLLKEFEIINPTINYGNITQRKSLQELLDKFGYDKLLATIKFAVSVQGKDYTPTITTPIQLKNKLGDLMVYYKKENTNSRTINI